MLAPDGRCKTLDANGDGYVRGEACVTLLLEDLELAETTAAILKGSAVNQACLLQSLHLKQTLRYGNSFFHWIYIAGV